jgi:hypothetical protein
MTTAFRIDNASRSATLGVLALLAAGVFIAGAWAGVVRAWPVRYSLRFIQELPKPFTGFPESRPLALDSAGRVLDYAGKIEVTCPEQTGRTAVILIAGQSNAANNAAQRHSSRHPDRAFNFVSGRCYAAASPLLGATGFAGESWTLLADDLLDAGAFDRVILAPVAVGSSTVEQWAKGGALNASMLPLLQEVTTRYRVTHVLWHQGESDFAFKTDPARYKDLFLSFVGSLRENSVDAPVYVSKASRCGPIWTESNPIRKTQQELASTGNGLKAGVNTDVLLNAEDRYDDCHFAESGQVKAAAAWAAILAPRP